MEINYTGLPTPWPINVFSVSFSLMGALAAKSRVNFLKKLALLYSFVRSWLVLVASWYSLNKQGVSGFYYPCLSFLLMGDAIIAMGLSTDESLFGSSGFLNGTFSFFSSLSVIITYLQDIRIIHSKFSFFF